MPDNSLIWTFNIAITKILLQIKDTSFLHRKKKINTFKIIEAYIQKIVKHRENTKRKSLNLSVYVCVCIISLNSNGRHTCIESTYNIQTNTIWEQLITISRLCKKMRNQFSKKYCIHLGTSKDFLRVFLLLLLFSTSSQNVKCSMPFTTSTNVSQTICVACVSVCVWNDFPCEPWK